MFTHMQKINLSLTSFLIYCKGIASLLFWGIWECLNIPIKIIVLFCSKLSYLFVSKKSTSSLASFLRYCKEIAIQFNSYFLFSKKIYIYIYKIKLQNTTKILLRI